MLHTWNVFYFWCTQPIVLLCLFVVVSVMLFLYASYRHGMNLMAQTPEQWDDYQEKLVARNAAIREREKEIDNEIMLDIMFPDSGGHLSH